ncbi:MAG TPA: FHA domain-containing protein [Patescibacteria group bacterium]|jgi:pSer/pThr/pTyr-binding forkhead associated (FHA) protein|nr:FHA domain-containing protein [Patescibacteria group bacterium]
MAKLVLLSEGLTGRSYELKVDRTTVGRVEDNAFPIVEASVSSHHCELLLRGGDVIVKDLNSTNGTFINGEKITEAALKPGQILRLGQVEMRLESGTSTAASTEKKKLEHTMVIPQGVKLNELEGGAKSVRLEKDSGFHKKSNKANLIFIGVGIFLAVVIIGFLVYALVKSSGPGQ